MKVLGILVAASVILSASTAKAATINVATFDWTIDASCEVDPSEAAGCFSTYALTLLWDGPLPVPVLTDGRVQTSLSPLPLTLLPVDELTLFDQVLEFGLSDFATVSFSFLFEGTVETLALTLQDPGRLDFQFIAQDPPSTAVPEPATLTLLGVGAAVAAARRRLRGRIPR